MHAFTGHLCGKYHNRISWLRCGNKQSLLNNPRIEQFPIISCKYCADMPNLYLSRYQHDQVKLNIDGKATKKMSCFRKHGTFFMGR